MSTINWENLGRSYKSLKPKLEPALQELANFNKKEIYFSYSLMNKLFGDHCLGNWYRRVSDLQCLGVIHDLKPIPGEIGYFYSKAKGLCRTFKLDKQLLKNSGYGKTNAPKQYDSFEPEVKHSCYVIKDFYLYIDNTEKLLKRLATERKTFKYSDDADEIVFEKLENLGDNLIGDIVQFDWKFFLNEDGSFNKDRYDNFILEITSKCIQIPKVIQDAVIAYNEKIIDEDFKVVFRPKITLNWTKTKVQVSAFCRMLSNFSNSHKIDRQSWLSRINLSYEKQFDIPAAVPSVMRLINKGKWDWTDPRMEIVKRSNIKNLTFAELKKMTFKLIFTGSSQEAWAHYNTILTKRGIWLKVQEYKSKYPLYTYITLNDGSKLDLNTRLTKFEFETMYNELHNVCGESLGVKVFYYESILELFAMRNLQEKGYTAVNVYDNIYSNASVNIIKREIKRATKLVLINQ
jgi:hypothetical protein